MNNLKLKHKILLSFIAAITVTVAALSAISFYNMKSQLYQDSTELVSGQSLKEADKIAD